MQNEEEVLGDASDISTLESVIKYVKRSLKQNENNFMSDSLNNFP